HTIVSKGTGAYVVWISTAELLVLSRYGQATVQYTNSGIPADSNWHYLAVTYAGSDGAVVLYVDGAVAASTNAAVPALVDNALELDIGTGNGAFNGTLDEVALYNVALTANQVLTHYTIGTGHAAVVRTSSATVATLTEAVARGVTAFARTVTDSVATLTEAVTRISAKARTVAQTLGATTEAVARVGTFARSQSDSLATLTESVSRIGTFARSVADAIATITEAVVGVKSGSNNFTATVADSLATLTEAVTRIGTFGRTQSDSVATITEVVGEDATEARTSADTIASITEATGRLGTFARSTSDTVASITEAVVGVVTPGGAHLDRTAGDTLSAVTESVARGTTTFSRTATDSIGAISEAITAPAAPITTPTGGGRAVAPDREHPPVPERRPRPVEREPVALVRSVREQVEFIDERLDSEVIESDEWLVLDMPELVLA
ncbi:MAG: LamG-like jellyroll fold domain-containing protein, partial [Nocardioidaceae bacterium]